jgi:hypothetical protein
MTKPQALNIDIEYLLANEVLPPESPEPESPNWLNWVDDLCKLGHGDEDCLLLGVKAWMKAEKKRNKKQHKYKTRYSSSD